MADKLFKASAKNHMKWISDGALDADFYVIAPDFMSALMKADEIVADLRAKLAEHRSVDGLRVCALSEVGDIANGIVMDREPETESWVEREARKLQERGV